MEKKFNKGVVFVFISFFGLFMGLLIYSSSTSDKESSIKRRLRTVTCDSLKQLVIMPYFGARKDLTNDTIRIDRKNEMLPIISALNNSTKQKYHGRGISSAWVTTIYLDYIWGKDITFDVLNTSKGICIRYRNSMMNPQYRCDELQLILEDAVNYKEEY